jgi:glycyl-tRNA synthetase
LRKVIHVVLMQDALLRLTTYWASRGCLIGQPMNTEVGAGTLNPATFLRVLGPEPWSVAYVEPSVRPDDSRYGDNPNRLQTHTQFQVILKPEPGNAQELYLGSLEVLGIPVDRHDIRFVEDNWASPALGAWGLGWEVWLDGLEITQFTYFQQAGGMALDPVSVEITYGMERIVMALQNVTHFKEIRYARGVSYGEAFGQAEYEMSAYYLDDADIDDVRLMFDAYEREARRLIEKQRPVPAHAYVLKCSHAFNVLDSRGAIGTTERARAFARMRTLAHQVAELWAGRRRELGYPLGTVTPPPVPAAGPERSPGAENTVPSTLVFEIGVEELPATEVQHTVASVLSEVARRLSGTRLRHGAVNVFGTPRRIVTVVEAVEPREDDHRQTVRGPRTSVAFDANGQSTRAAAGFARSQGTAVEALDRVVVDGVEHVSVTREVSGRPAAEVIGPLLAEVVAGLRSDRNMRWSAPGLSFSRPIRWLTALLGDEVVPFTVSTLTSGRTTWLRRTDPEPTLEARSAGHLLTTLEERGIVVDGSRRRQIIATQAEALAATVAGRVDVAGEAALLDEIANLVEQPFPVIGHFDDRYLILPIEVLSNVMKKHQRYLPVRSDDGALLPHFVAVANGDCDRELVRAGYEAVLRARYEDAMFFWEGDLRTAPAEMKAGLARLTFEERLGSMAARADRIRSIALDLAAATQLGGDELATLERASELAKFDLASHMVIELSSLAGVMAREYARRAGETPAVADALFEMELPRSAGDALPATLPGAVLALADRFDLLAGLFAVDQVPTGSSDPFGLRRAALGVAAILRTRPELAAITVHEGLAVAASHQSVPVSQSVLDEAANFVVRRFEQQLQEAGHPVEHVRAIAPLAGTPALAQRTLSDLESLHGQESFQRLVTALQRVDRIVPGGVEAAYSPELLDDPAEQRLHAALTQAARRLGANGTSLQRFTEAAEPLIEPIDGFFTDVLVMAPDPAVRANRLGLLAAIRDLGSAVLAWRELR